VGTQPAGTPERRFNGESARIEGEAARWLILLDGNPTASNFRALNEWLSARARHRAAFLRLSVAWSKMDRLRALPSDSHSSISHSVPIPMAAYVVAFVVVAALTAFALAIWLR
jgi:ferric-dicitrate binding protein FerR (iron transport regulator)